MVEDLGFESAWMGDAAFRQMSTWPDPLQWLLAAALGTKNMELGTAVYQVPLRDPVIVAKRLATFETLVPGRLSLGIGPGSTPLAFEAVGASFEERFKTTNRNMRTIRALCSGESAESANLGLPPEAHQGPRFLLGAWYGGKNLLRAANEYDGWLSSAKWTRVGNMADAIKRYQDAGGTRAIVATTGIDLRAVGTDLGDEDSFTLACSPTEAADRLAWLDALGYTDIILHVRDGVNGVFDSDLYQDSLAEIRSIHPRAATITVA